jgi:hypothetical protein
MFTLFTPYYTCINKRVVTLDIHPVALAIGSIYLYFRFSFCPSYRRDHTEITAELLIIRHGCPVELTEPFMRHHRAQVLGSSVNFSKSLNQRIQNRLWGLDGTLLLCGTESCGQWLATSNGGRFDFFDVGS